MKMIKAVVRPEKSSEVLDTLRASDFPATTHYDEIPKDMILIVVDDSDVDKVVKIITDTAKTGKTGTYGDGKIFIIPVERCVTISSGKDEL